MKEFAGRVAVVTGAGSGMGRELAIQLANQGTRLALSDIDLAAVQATAEACAGAGIALPYHLDVSDRSAVYRHAEQVATDIGPAELVVNNAGVAVLSDVETLSWDDFEWLMKINFWGVVHGSKAFLPQLVASGDGHLVNMSSIYGIVAMMEQSCYSAAKFAVRGFTEALRLEMRKAGHKVQVSCVHPGGIRTNIVRSARLKPDQDRAELARGFDKIAPTSAAGAARTILRGVQRNKPRILVGPDAHAINLLHRLIGIRYQSLVARPPRAGGRPAGRAS